jgi:hypothetical protein
LTAAEIMAGPGRIECSRLRANISARQCAINQAQAKVDPWGPLAPCRRCDQADRARGWMLPQEPVGTHGLGVKTREYQEMESRGEVTLSQFGNQGRATELTGDGTEEKRDQTKDQPGQGRRSLKAEVMDLRDRSTRAGWSSRQIDRRLRQLNQKASRAVRLALVRAWREELEGLNEL